MNETEIRIIIDHLLRQAGWRLPGDIAPNVRAGQRITGERSLEADYVLNDDKCFPLAVLEVKRSEIGALSGKEQAREYAKELKAPFVILSNGKEHYFWNMAKHHEPMLIKKLFRPDELKEQAENLSNARDFHSQIINEQYISNAQGENCPPHKRRKLRNYQIDAVKAVQSAAAAGRGAFLLEMATGTGKTLVAAAAIRLFLMTQNTRRVLFIVDRLELEDQAKQNFEWYFGNSWETVVYKEHLDDWNRAEVLVSTVQTLAAGDRYKSFSPLQFGLVIVDEAHRAISGRNARAVFDYFHAYKLGLTATPKDYMKNTAKSGISPREQDARKLRDTYHIFGCADGTPTFRYDLEQGAAENNLIMPRTIDVRTDVTTEMFSEKGFYFIADDDNDDENDNAKTEKGPYWKSDFEQMFFSDATNRVICRAIIENAMCDPLSGDVGKSIVYCVSQRHAEKITAILNELAAQQFPGVYQSDFAQQVTSNVKDAQDRARRFANNTLGGRTRALEGYDSTKTRVCVTVGMMTTGYDCPDILNICMLRPIFSPSEFIQIRGRGTRPHKFQYDGGGGDIRKADKDTFMLFDFFAVCEYFQTKDYDEQLSLTSSDESRGRDDNKKEITPPKDGVYGGPDEIKRKIEIVFGEGMRIDQKQNADADAEQKLLTDNELQQAVKEKRMSDVEFLCGKNHPKEIIDFLQRRAKQHSILTHRRVNIGEILMLIFDEITELESREEMMDKETEKFIAGLKSDDSDMTAAAAEIFKACLDDKEVMEIIENETFADLADNSVLSIETCGKVPREIRLSIVKYLKTKIDLDIYTQNAA